MATQPFDWSEYHRLAQELVNQSGESYLRTGVSRAYYYVFHLARQRLIDNRFPILEKQDSHKQVWEKFNASPDHRCRKLAETAKRLKEKREVADYEPHYPQIIKDAPAMVALAAQFAIDLSHLEANLPRNTGVRR
jgi:hypothetical protein